MIQTTALAGDRWGSAAAWLKDARKASWLAVAFGACLQLVHYLGGRTLWLDEAMISLNITRLTPLQMTQGLDYQQTAPIGWLVLQKFVYGLIPSPELALRLVSLAAGLASLLMFRMLALRVLSGPAAVVTIAAFAILEPVVHQAAEAKPYILDMALALAALQLTMPLLQTDQGFAKRLGLLTALGVVGITLSLPMIYVLAGLGCTLLTQKLTRGRTKAAVAACGAGALWLALFAILWLQIYANFRANSASLETSFFRDAFPSLPPQSLRDLVWLPEQVSSFLKFVFGERSWMIALVLAGLGVWRLWIRDQWLAVAVLAPFVVALAGAVLHLYPLFQRLLSFLVPSVVLLCGVGVQWLTDAARKPVALAAVLGCALLSGSILAVFHSLSSSPPYSRHHMRPAFAILDRERQPGDKVVVSRFAAPTYEFYRGLAMVKDGPVIVSGEKTPDWRCSLEAAGDPPVPGRIWVLMVTTTEPLTESVEEGLADLSARGFEAKAVEPYVNQDVALARFDITARRPAFSPAYGFDHCLPHDEPPAVRVPARLRLPTDRQP